VNPISRVMNHPLDYGQMFPPPVPIQPLISTPANRNRVYSPTFPEHLQNLPTATGYQEAHDQYELYKSFFHQQVHDFGPKAELMSIKFWLQLCLPNRSTFLPISVGLNSLFRNYQLTTYQDICETVSGIPVFLGADDLKKIGIVSLAHKFIEWTNGMALEPKMVKLCNPQWEEFIGRDAPAVRHLFVKTSKGGKEIFDRKKVLELVLALGHKVYNIALVRSNKEQVFVALKSVTNTLTMLC
jgi:hypothetical protein